MINEEELKNVNRVAVMMSGGVDSTILLWKLWHLSMKHGFFIDVVTVDNIMNYEQNAYAITYSKWFPTHNNWMWYPRYPNILMKPEDTSFIDATIYRIYMDGPYDMGPPDLLYTGANKIPGFHISGSPKRVDPSVLKRLPNLRMPFIDQTKDTIFKHYLDNDLLDLYALTHSCTNQKVGECGTCFQCVEKRWAERMNQHART